MSKPGHLTLLSGGEPRSPMAATGDIQQFDGGGGPPHNSSMEARVTKLENSADDAKQRLARIEGKLDHLATKAELADMKADLIKWIVGTAIALGSTAIVVMTFVLNNATPKAPPLQQPAPTVIVVPAATAASHASQ